MDIILTNASQAVIIAFERGYRTDGVDVFSPDGNKLKLLKGHYGYLSFGIRHPKTKIPVMVHRLVAYQKYGIMMFEQGKEVRHLNGNELDNTPSNIKLGTHQENMLDIPLEVRMRSVLIATSFAKKHDHVAILEMHNSGMSYARIMKETGIKSKGTISFIIKKSVTKKEII